MTAARSLSNNWSELIAEEASAGVQVIEIKDDVSRAKKDQLQVLVGNELSPAEILNTTLEKGYRHTIQHTSNVFETELLASAKLELDPKRLQCFPVSAILDPAACGPEAEKRLQLFTKTFSIAREKSGILREVEEMLSDKIKSTGLKADIVTVSDELLTNAIFNAPFVDLQNSHPGESRENPSVQMTDGKTGDFFIGADAERIVIGCRDPYGSLNPKKLLERIRNCYLRSVAATMNMEGSGGAGIGSFMVFNSSTSYYVSVDKMKTTVVCAVMPIKGSGRARQEAPKNIHIINLEETDNG